MIGVGSWPLVAAGARRATSHRSHRRSSIPFRAPACAYCPGNRGLEYDAAVGSPVRAAAAGTVTFAGVVAGVRYVVVAPARRSRRPTAVWRRARWCAGDVGGGRASRSARPPTASTSACAQGDDTSIRRRSSGDAPIPAAARSRRRIRAAPSPAADHAMRGIAVGGGRAPARADSMSDRLVNPDGHDIIVSLRLRSPRRQEPVRRQPQREEYPSWPSSPCDRCWKRVSTSGTRPAVGTRR